MILMSLITFVRIFPFLKSIFIHKVIFFFTMEKENIEKVEGKVILPSGTVVSLTKATRVVED